MKARRGRRTWTPWERLVAAAGLNVIPITEAHRIRERLEFEAFLADQLTQIAKALTTPYRSRCGRSRWHGDVGRAAARCAAADAATAGGSPIATSSRMKPFLAQQSSGIPVDMGAQVRALYADANRERITVSPVPREQALRAAEQVHSKASTRTISRPRAYVFRLSVNWMKFYWTGRYDRAGHLERSPHRADAIKFPDQATALAVAETHDELRDSSEWKVVPMMEGRQG